MEETSATERAYGWLRTHPMALDGVLAAACALVLMTVSFAITGRWGAGEVLGLGMTAALAWRRTRPVLSATLVGAAGYLQLFTVDALVPADGVVLLSLYALAAYGPDWAGRLGLLFAVVGAPAAVLRYLLSPAIGGAPGTVVTMGFAATLVLAAWLLGRLRRLSVQNERRLAERARLLETEREQETRLAATAERARIAREMHDVVAHSLSVTIAQADGGRYAASADPAAAVAALETIAVTSRQALTDMRALLGVLRDGEQGAYAPQPDITSIPELVSQVAASGLAVRMEVEGQGRPMPPGPELTAYRIVQESLTNVLKHGGPNATALVHLYWSLNGLTVTVTDDGRGAAAVAPPEAGGGQGVLGMRERASLHGGRLDAGPRRGGGYSVRAFLPYVRTP